MLCARRAMAGGLFTAAMHTSVAHHGAAQQPQAKLGPSPASHSGASLTMARYLALVKRSLEKALCIQSFPSPKIDRISAPEVETRDVPDLLLPGIIIRRNDREFCLIESSINSVRVSLRLSPGDALEEELLIMYMRFLMQRADGLQCLRKVPVQGYHISFLITDTHLVTLGKAAIIGLVTTIIQQSESEISTFKSAVNARGRAVATQLLKSLAF